MAFVNSPMKWGGFLRICNPLPENFQQKNTRVRRLAYEVKISISVPPNSVITYLLLGDKDSY